MGVPCTVSDIDARGCLPTRAFFARTPQYPSLRRENGCPRRLPPNDFPPWTAASRQARRWIDGGVLEQSAHDLRVVLRFLEGRADQPSAVILDGRTLPSTPESGGRAGHDGAETKKGSKVHVAVDPLGNLPALKVASANEQERAQVAELARKVQEVTGGTVEIGYVDQGYFGEDAARQAENEGIKLEVVTHTEANKRFVLLARRWVVERSYGWLGRFRRRIAATCFARVCGSCVETRA